LSGRISHEMSPSVKDLIEPPPPAPVVGSKLRLSVL
jgi:hypothetical protein